MYSHVALATILVVPLLVAPLQAQSVPEVGQGPPTRRDSRWRIQQERADYLNDLRKEIDYLRRHQSIAEVVPFVPRVAQRGLQSLGGQHDEYRTRWRADRHRMDAVPYGYEWPAINPYARWYPYLPLFLSPGIVFPQREAKRGLMRLGSAEPAKQPATTESVAAQFPLLSGLTREYERPRARAENEFDVPAPPRRPRPPVGSENRNVPDYCYSGDGHPLGGREWCYRHGYEVGGGWVRESGGNLTMERPQSPLNRTALAASIGDDFVVALDVQRVRFGLNYPLTGSYVATLENGNVLRVRSGRWQIAEVSDHDRDGRVDAIWRRANR